MNGNARMCLFVTDGIRIDVRQHRCFQRVGNIGRKMEGARLSVEALVGWGFLNSTRAFGVVFFFLGARRYIRGLFFIHRKLFY
ncbi:hypothetical protein ALO82_200014 [Pseudomonas syringae pv. broussonetiae]|nr:hypothetical protein ALO82_200014 [Pseudomonas syringae pv. broussonetiae]